MCCAWMPGVSRVNLMGLPPGFQRIGGLGISMRATVQAWSDSLHSAKATGRPRSVSFRPLPVNTYCSSWSSSNSRACDTRSRIWSSRVTDTTIASSSHFRGRDFRGFRLGDGQRDFAFRRLRFGGGFLVLGGLRLLRPGTSMLSKDASPSPGSPCNVVHAARSSDRAASSAAAAACRVQGVISPEAPIDSGAGSVFDDSGL